MSKQKTLKLQAYFESHSWKNKSMVDPSFSLPNLHKKKLGEIPNWQVKIKGCKQQHEEPSNNVKGIEKY
jgi:hypothetical protein